MKAAKKHRDAASALRAWIRVVQDAHWNSLKDVRSVYPSADGVQVRSGTIATVFNIRGNTYRLIVTINYGREIVRINEFLTHAEYDKDFWKDRL